MYDDGLKYRKFIFSSYISTIIHKFKW